MMITTKVDDDKEKQANFNDDDGDEGKEVNVLFC